MKKYFFAVLFFTLAAFAPQTAAAQAPSPFGSSVDFINRMNIYNAAKMNAMLTGRKTRSSSRNSGGASTGAATPKTVRGTTTFKPTGTLIMPKEFAAYFYKTEKEKRSGESAFTKGLKDFEKLHKEVGFAANDVARAKAAFFIICLSTYRNQQLTPKQKDGIYKMLKNLFETDKTFQSLGDLDRQRDFETTGILWSFVYIAYVAAEQKGDAASRAKVKDASEYLFGKFVGVPISSVRLKSDGIEID